MGTDRFIRVWRGGESRRRSGGGILWPQNALLLRRRVGGGDKGKEGVFGSLLMGNRRESDPGLATQGPYWLWR